MQHFLIGVTSTDEVGYNKRVLLLWEVCHISTFLV